MNFTLGNSHSLHRCCTLTSAEERQGTGQRLHSYISMYVDGQMSSYRKELQEGCNLLLLALVPPTLVIPLCCHAFEEKISGSLGESLHFL